MINIRQKNIALDAVESYTAMLESTGRPEAMLKSELAGIIEAVYCLGFNDTYKQLTTWANNNHADKKTREAIKLVLEILKAEGLKD